MAAAAIGGPCGGAAAVLLCGGAAADCSLVALRRTRANRRLPCQRSAGDVRLVPLPSVGQGSGDGGREA
eukprot:222665-Prymnesium_polylepis.1